MYKIIYKKVIIILCLLSSSFVGFAADTSKSLCVPDIINDQPSATSDVLNTFKGSLADESFLRAAFEHSIKMSNIANSEEYLAYFAPSQPAIEKYIAKYATISNTKKRCACQYTLTCRNMNKCNYWHFIVGAFHSTEHKFVKQIFTTGFEPSNSTKSMGSGVYFTTSMRGNNRGAYEKSHGYGDIVIICLVITHDGINEVKVNEPWTTKAQTWLQRGADIKFMRAGVKTSDRSSKEYAGENVVRDAEKIIPLGIIYPRTLTNPLLTQY